MLDRGVHVMRLQDRVLKAMMNDTQGEYDEIQNTAITPATNMKHFVRDTMNRLEKSRARFADIELMLQIFFCRYYDYFEIFVEDLLGDIVRRDASLLDGIRLRNVDDSLSSAEKLERRMEKVARLPLGQIVDTIAEQMSFDLMTDSVKARLVFFSDVRNLLTHRSGIVDRHFLQRHPSCGLEIGDTFVVTMEFTRDALADMTKAAADIQARATAHFNYRYETVLVGENAWWEEPDAPLPDLPPLTDR